MKKQFIQAIFCPPNDKMDNPKVANRITDQTFSMLKEMGINKLFGFGYDSRKETIVKTLQFCEKYGIDYFLQLKTADEYISTPINTKGKKPFCELTDEERQDLDKRFVAEITEYLGYKAMKGVLFEDEAGYLSFDGVAYAKKIFDREFPDLEFHTNFLCYTINENMFWASFVSEPVQIDEKLKPFKLEGKNAVTFENRFNYYDLFVEGLLSKANLEYFSFDKYPFELDWKECPHFMHNCFVDSVAFLRTKKDKYKNKFYTYIATGSWFKNGRQDLTKSEFLLTMNICALYGLDGFAYFPGFYPIDFVLTDDYINSNNGEAGLVDINGKLTKFGEYLIEINKFFEKIQDDYLSSMFVGVKTYGNYDNGFSQKDVQDLPDKEVIFNGELAPYYKMDKQSVEITKADNCLAVAEFVNDGKKRFFLTNMATEKNLTFTAKFGKSYYVVVTKDAEITFESNLTFTLGGGEGVYIIEI